MVLGILDYCPLVGKYVYKGSWYGSACSGSVLICFVYRGGRQSNCGREIPRARLNESSGMTPSPVAV